MKQLNTGIIDTSHSENAVSGLLEYLIISGIMVLFIVVTIPLVTTIFIEQPTNQLTMTAFVDIGNGVSTRIVDLYALAPVKENIPTDIITKFDIPDDIAGKDYWVEISGGKEVVISRGDYETRVSLGGIGMSTLGSTGGRTTASGINQIEFHNPPP